MAERPLAPPRVIENPEADPVYYERMLNTIRNDPRCTAIDPEWLVFFVMRPDNGDSTILHMKRSVVHASAERIVRDIPAEVPQAERGAAILRSLGRLYYQEWSDRIVTLIAQFTAAARLLVPEIEPLFDVDSDRFVAISFAAPNILVSGAATPEHAAQVMAYLNDLRLAAQKRDWGGLQ